MATTAYAAEVRHDGRLYTFTVPGLRIPVCRECVEKVFTDYADRQVNEAFQMHLGAFTPESEHGITATHGGQLHHRV